MTMPTTTTAKLSETKPATPIRTALMNEISERIRRPFLIGMAILLIAGLASYFALARYRNSNQQVALSDDVISQLNDLLSDLDRVEATERGYLTSGNAPDGRAAALIAAIHQELDQIRQAARDGAIAQRDAEALSAQVEAKLKFFDQVSALRASQGEAAATAMFTAGQADNLLSAIHDHVQQMTSAQERILASQVTDEHLLSHLLGFLVVAGCMLAFGAIAYAAHFVEGAFKLITNHLTEDARGREALATLNETLEERINERSAAAAQATLDLDRARKDLRHQGQILQVVLNSISEGVLVCDTHMRLLQTNAAAERLLGEGFGRQSLDHLPRAFEMVDAVAAKPVEAGKWPLAQAVRGHQCQLDFHLRNRESGETHLIESTSVPLCDENGAVRAAIGLIRDVTPVAKGQQAAALLEAITVRSDDAFIAIGRDGKVVSWNVSATRMFGYAPDEIIGHACRRIVSDEAITLTRDVSQRMLAGGGPERFMIEAVRKDGSRLPVMVEAYPLNDTLGEDAAFMLICRNVTDQKLLRAEAANARAIVLDEARKRFEFLINMSHEFRTSLNRIMGVLPLLVESSLSGQQRDYVRSISSSTEGLLEAVNDILDLAGLAAGKVVFDQSEFDLYETVEAAIDIAAEHGQSKDIELVLTMGPDLPHHLMGDRTRVAQVLATVVDSSIKFNDHGEVVVNVDCAEREADFTAVRFEVRGTGTGMPPELQARLFEPFLASDSGTLRDLGGTGLSLAIAAQLVERMGGGSITVGGQAGHGSVLRFTLRFANVTEADHRQGLWPELASRRILVVDDNATCRVSICGQLAQWGLAPESAIGGAEALVAMRQAAAADRPYDFVLADMRMPGMDGFALQRAIKSDPHLGRTQLVMMGPFGVPEQPDTDGWLVKPIKPTRLFDCLNRLSAGPAEQARDEPLSTNGSGPSSQEGSTASNGLTNNGYAASNGHADSNGCPSLDRSVLDALRAFAGGNAREVIGTLTTAFTCDLPMRIAQMEMALAAGDRAAFTMRAAGLRGLAGGLGLKRMAALCNDLATLAERDDLRAPAITLAALRDEATAVLPLLEHEAGSVAAGDDATSA